MIQKRFRFRKVTPEILEEMKVLRHKGLTYKEIGIKFGVSGNMVGYHLNPQIKEGNIERAKIYQKEMSKKEKREKTRKHQEYNSKYLNERYNNDKEFHDRINEGNKIRQKKLRRLWKEKGLCSSCGRKREDKWKFCRRCRRNK